ncbi:molybdopterin oxidoreductase, partial [Bacillus sp. AFS076308]
VTADRTQAPSGAGYALENRTIVSRAFPELYRDLKVQHLAGFFRTLQETLARQAPRDDEAPLIVLLTPGRFNESYFEHLYLARQLGYPLVEGGDLT